MGATHGGRGIWHGPALGGEVGGEGRGVEQKDGPVREGRRRGGDGGPGGGGGWRGRHEEGQRQERVLNTKAIAGRAARPLLGSSPVVGLSPPVREDGDGAASSLRGTRLGRRRGVACPSPGKTERGWRSSAGAGFSRRALSPLAEEVRGADDVSIFSGRKKMTCRGSNPGCERGCSARAWKMVG